jgi:hypothetical protein
MTQLYHNYADIENSMVAYTASDYCSGWMNGRARLATLSDTTPGSLQYDNLLTNGTFDSDTSGWTAGTGATLSSSSGQLVITQSSGSNGRAQSNSFATELDKHYMFTVDGISTTASNFRMEVRGPELVDTTFTAGQEGVIFFRGTGSNMYVELYNIGGTGTATTYDNAFVTQVVDNRTYFNRNDLGTPTTAGVKLFGRLERRPVAPGADLVSYSGFSSAAYLRQPYDDNLDFGNGQDFCFNMWFRTPDPSEFGVLLHRSATVNGAGTWAGSGPIVQVEFNTSHLRNGIYGNAFGTQANIDVPYTQYKENTWHMHTFLRRGDTTEVYKDGVLMDKLNNANSSQTLSGSRASLWIGNRPDYGNRPFNGDIALFRVTSEAPTPHQIKKMYNDEKYLFKKDAKCTLYGTSDTVSAIAYDPITKVTHAGTSQGRSSFQGLTRIDNTADGVGYFLSAHDGFVVEG